MSHADTSKGKGKILKRANPSTIHDKFLVGYQGWFTCAGDGEPVGPGHHGWLHWFNFPIPDGGRPNTDLWPDVSSYSPSELFPAPGLKIASGDQAFLFSSRHPKTVQRHFHWMAEHGVDGAFLQRFVGQCDLETGNEGIRRIRDEVGDRVREAAEKEGRVFAIMYDVSGVDPNRVQRVIERDWVHLIREKGVLDSPNYLKEKGKPVIALWGFGFENAGHTPELVRSITTYIRSVTPGGAYIMAGTPAHWRTAESDADRNPGFLDVWLNDFDAISPWTVGRYRTEQDADHFAETKMKGDAELIKKRNEEGRWRKIDYIPVVLPGGSGFNLSEGKWGFNDIKRKGGRFLWRQISNAKRQGVRTIYGAMWDEYDEGTAFMPVVENKRMLPESDKYPFMALDEDGYDLPSDWYMRICGFAAEGLRSERRIHETFPSKELQDYWGSRPRYEEINAKSGDFVSGSSKETEDGATSGTGDGQSYQDWLAAQKSEDKEEPPPPPYSLEADESTESGPQPVTAPAPSVPVGPTSSVAPVPAHASRPVPVSASRPAPEPECTQPILTSPTAQTSPPTHNHHPQALGPTGPPPINTSSRPQQAPGSLIGHPNGTPPVAAHDPVISLTDAFGRHGVSSPTRPGHIASTSPPPLHPAHPAATAPSHDQSRPQLPSSRPQVHSRPHSGPRPQSQSGYAHLSAPSTPNQSAVPPQSQPQWPPPEWGIGATSQHQQQQPPNQQSSYPGQVNAGTNVNTVISHSSSLSHRPSGRPSQSRPDSPGQYQGATGGQHLPTSVHQPPRPSSSSYMPPFPASGAPSFPSGSNMPSYSPVSTYPGSSYPGQAGYSPPPITGQGFPSVHSSPPHSPIPGSFSYGGSTYPGQVISQPYNPAQSSSYLGQPYPTGASSVPSHVPAPFGRGSNDDSPGGIYFPQAQGDYYNTQQPPSQASYAPGYIGHQSANSHHSQDHQASIPTPVTGWYPGRSSSPMPPSIPPRPPQSHAPYSSSPSSGPSFPMASTAGAGALGFALSAVDKVAGRKTREQLESGVGSLAQSGSKLLNKFTK